MHLKGGKSSPGYLAQVGPEPWPEPRNHVDGGGERRGKGEKGGREPRLAAAAPLPPAPRRTGAGGEGCGPHLPISRTIKTTFKFFSPALISFIKKGGSLTPFILRQVRLRLRRRGWEGSGTMLPTLLGWGEGGGATLGGGGERKGRKRLVRDRECQPRRH